MAEKSGIRGIVAAAAGGIIFVLFLILGLPIPVGIGAAVVAFAVSLFFFRSPRVREEESQSHVQLASVVIKSIKEKLDTLAKLANSLPSGEVKERLYAIAKLTERIMDDVKSDPKDAGAAGRFIDYYADAAIKIARMYGELAQRGVKTETAREIGLKVLKNLAALEHAFEVQLGKLQEDNLLDLDTELTVLEKTLETDGIQAMINEQKKVR